MGISNQMTASPLTTRTWFLKQEWKLCTWYMGFLSLDETASFLSGRMCLLSDCQYHRCSEEWGAFVLGQFILTKFIGKQTETINTAFAQRAKGMSDKTIGFCALQRRVDRIWGAKY